MKKRAFLKLSSALVVAPSSRSALAPGPAPTNWAGDVRYGYRTPSIIRPRWRTCSGTCGRTPGLKVLGSRHCFNGIADSQDSSLAMSEMNRVVALDAARRRVTVEAGIAYGQLSPLLHDKGFALHNLASLPHISVAGACSTATHGSGVTTGISPRPSRHSRSSLPPEMSVALSADGDRERLNATVVHLGALGIVTKVTLALQPTFSVRQHVYERLPLPALKEHFARIMSAGYSVSLFTDWQRPSSTRCG